MCITVLDLPHYEIQAIEDGYRYRCPCGELCNTVAAAFSCRKCRYYSIFGGEYVTDIATGEVFGTMPTLMERESRVADHTAQMAADHAAELAAWKREMAEMAENEAIEKLLVWDDMAAQYEFIDWNTTSRYIAR